MKRTVVTIMGLLAIDLLFSCSFAQAQAGTLDPGFGTGGKVTTPNLGGIGPVTAIEQTNGDIVLLENIGADSIALVRYTSGGVLDTSFGTSGITTTVLSTYSNVPIGIVVLPNNKIIVANLELSRPGLIPGIILVRYRSNGALDTTFGSGGIVTTSLTDVYLAGALLLQPNGQIVVGTWGTALPTTLVRYDSNGALDTTFGTDGIAQAPTGVVEIAALALLSNGDYLFGGLQGYELVKEGTLVEFNSKGVPQSTVTESPVSVASQSPNESALSAFQFNGDFVVATRVVQTAPSATFVELGRYTETGAEDPTFNSMLFQLNLEANGNNPDAIALQSDGKILVGGLASSTQSGLYDFGLVRLNSNGTFDATFGSGGRVTDAPFGWISGLLIQKDGKIVAVGGAPGGTLARYLAN